MSKTNLAGTSFIDGYQTKLCKFNEDLYFSTSTTRTNPEKTTGITLHIYKTSSSQSIAMGTNTAKVNISSINPPPGLCSPINVVAKVNGNCMDYEGGLPFFGIHLAAGILSMEGNVGMAASSTDAQTLYNNCIYEANYRSYYPSFCIKWDDSVVVRWLRYAAVSPNIISVPDAVKTYNRIIGCAHCLVYKSRSVFDTVNPIISDEGTRCGDPSKLYKGSSHFNPEIASGTYHLRCRRTLLGHHKNGFFLLINVEGDADGSKSVKGMNLMECSWLLQELGCDYGMNMDGGSCTQMRESNTRLYPGPKEPSINTYMGSAVCVYKKT